MLLFEVLDIRRAPLASEQVLGFSIDFATPGDPSTAYAVEVGGWVVARNCPASAVVLAYEGAIFDRVRLGIFRPDIAALYPDVVWAEESGFRASASVPGVTPEVEVSVDVMLHDGGRITLGVIHARRGWRDLDSSSAVVRRV